MPYDTERTPLLTPATAGLTSKILSEVSFVTSAGAHLNLEAQLTIQTKVYPLIHLIRCDIVAHIGMSELRGRSSC
jgi:hypothetical protein